MAQEIKKLREKDEVRTPEGVGEIKEESQIGEFRIHIPGVGFRWYFPEDLELIKKGKGVAQSDRDPG